MDARSHGRAPQPCRTHHTIYYCANGDYSRCHTTASLIQEGMEVYKRIDEGKFRLGAYFEQVLDAMPAFVHDALNRTGLGDAASIREKISSSAMEASKFVAK